MGLATGVKGALHEIGNGDPGNLDRILERHEKTGPGTFLGLHRQKILPIENHGATGHDVIRLACKDGRKGALA